ncbi:hypothetical protein [Carnobacterium inhibens]|uniref:hypothetical protein n=1 Tax=Carnobacterium inhibens TaxID=147709 RepID=UPI0020416352|nr:hypothetical protein [Carnobacterium inhibens]MCM3511625.1 hypothetical protein [Carnobacterium inhibens]
MDFFESNIQLSLLITLFKHNGLKIEVFNSTKDDYVNISYETRLVTYPFKNVTEANSFGNYLINTYLNEGPSVEEFFNKL